MKERLGVISDLGPGKGAEDYADSRRPRWLAEGIARL